MSNSKKLHKHLVPIVFVGFGLLIFTLLAINKISVTNDGLVLSRSPLLSTNLLTISQNDSGLLQISFSKNNQSSVSGIKSTSINGLSDVSGSGKVAEYNLLLNSGN